jgi:hypothetical protein
LEEENRNWEYTFPVPGDTIGKRMGIGGKK